MHQCKILSLHQLTAQHQSIRFSGGTRGEQPLRLAVKNQYNFFLILAQVELKISMKFYENQYENSSSYVQKLWYLEGMPVETLRCVDAANDLKSLTFPCIFNVKNRASNNRVYISGLQLLLHKLIIANRSNLCFPCNNNQILCLNLNTKLPSP